MTDLASVLKGAKFVRGLGIARRQSRIRLRQLVSEANRARRTHLRPTREVIDHRANNRLGSSLLMKPLPCVPATDFL